MLKYFILALLACFTVACGPIYETSYTYKNPKNIQGKRCVNQCLWQKNRCQGRCQNRRARCLDQISQDNNRRRDRYERCVKKAFNRFMRRQPKRHHNKHHNKHHKPRKHQQPRFNPANYGCEKHLRSTSVCNVSCDCQPAYKACFVNCGGLIIPHTKCIAFCKKAH